MILQVSTYNETFDARLNSLCTATFISLFCLLFLISKWNRLKLTISNPTVKVLHSVFFSSLILIFIAYVVIYFWKGWELQGNYIELSNTYFAYWLITDFTMISIVDETNNKLKIMLRKIYIFIRVTWYCILFVTGAICILVYGFWGFKICFSADFHGTFATQIDKFNKGHKIFNNFNLYYEQINHGSELLLYKDVNGYLKQKIGYFPLGDSLGYNYDGGDFDSIYPIILSKDCVMIGNQNFLVYSEKNNQYAFQKLYPIGDVVKHDVIKTQFDSNIHFDSVFFPNNRKEICRRVGNHYDNGMILSPNLVRICEQKTIAKFK